MGNEEKQTPKQKIQFHRTVGTYIHDDVNRKSRKFWSWVNLQGEEEEARRFYERVYGEQWSIRIRQTSENSSSLKMFCRMAALSASVSRFPEDPEKQRIYFLNQEKIRQISIARARQQANEEVMLESRQRMNARNRFVMGQLRDKPDTTLMDDIEFARKHLHLIGETGEQSTWFIQPRESPSASAWNMLMYAVDNAKDFNTMAIRQRKESDERAHQLKLAELKGQEGGRDGKPRDPMRQTIREMMARINEEVDEEVGDEVDDRGG